MPALYLLRDFLFSGFDSFLLKFPKPTFSKRFFPGAAFLFFFKERCLFTVRTNDRIQNVKMIAAAAIFCALAYASEYVFHVKVMFLTFDIKDAIIAIAAMIFGPVYAVLMGFAVATLELFTMSDTGLYGFIMNVLSTVTFTAIASLIYRYKKTLFGAVLGFVTGAVTMTAVMCLANYLITPYYMGVTRGEIVAYIPKLFLPFNLLKAVFNASIAMLFYKYVVTALRRARVLPRRAQADRSEVNGESSSAKLPIRTVTVTVCSIIVAALAIALLIFVLNARIEWF